MKCVVARLVLASPSGPINLCPSYSWLEYVPRMPVHRLHCGALFAPSGKGFGRWRVTQTVTWHRDKVEFTPVLHTVGACCPPFWCREGEVCRRLNTLCDSSEQKSLARMLYSHSVFVAFLINHYQYTWENHWMFTLVIFPRCIYFLLNCLCILLRFHHTCFLAGYINKWWSWNLL